MGSESITPTVFVVMPYGLKADPSSGITIDFDDVWESAFVPAAHAAGVGPVRADEERVGGFVHLAMFERLLLAEIVLADLTLASPNVMYELGIRHATRPRATIPVFARVGALPFDLSPIRAVPYRLKRDGRLGKSARAELIEVLTGRLTAALTDTATDSPLFQLIKSYPGVTLPHDVTESFQQRVQKLTTLSNDIHEAAAKQPRTVAIDALLTIQRQLMSSPGAPSELLIDLLLAYRDTEAHSEMVALAEQLPAELRGHPAVGQAVAFALNRRNGPGDRERAVELLETMVAERGADPETLGLLGRVHKDRYTDLLEDSPLAAEAALEAAIDAYERGFRADPRDYYPGVNAVTLLMVQGTDESYRKARELSPVVAFAVACRQGMASSDYWDVATVLELAVVNLDEAAARAALRRVLYLAGPPWRRDTTAANIRRLVGAHARRGITSNWIAEVVTELEKRQS